MSEQEANYVTGYGDKTDAEKYQPYVRFYEKAMHLLLDACLRYHNTPAVFWAPLKKKRDALKAEVVAHEAVMGEANDVWAKYEKLMEEVGDEMD